MTMNGSQCIEAPCAQIYAALREVNFLKHRSRFDRIGRSQGNFPEALAETHGRGWSSRAFILIGASAIAITLGTHWCCFMGNAHLVEEFANAPICRSQV
jgi:hypothetical protein